MVLSKCSVAVLNVECARSFSSSSENAKIEFVLDKEMLTRKLYDRERLIGPFR